MDEDTQYYYLCDNCGIDFLCTIKVQVEDLECDCLKDKRNGEMVKVKI